LKYLAHDRGIYREKLHQANSYGFTVPEENTKIDWPTLKNKRDKYIERLNGIYEKSESDGVVSSSRRS